MTIDASCNRVAGLVSTYAQGQTSLTGDMVYIVGAIWRKASSRDPSQMVDVHTLET